MPLVLRAALLGIVLAASGPDPVLPLRLLDVDGAPVDLGALAAGQRLFVVTMKTASCPVCAQQLARLERQRPALELCGARFVILAPGPAEGIRAARQATGLRARWVEDADLGLARSLDLLLAPGQIVPAILELDPGGRVVWQQRGRNGSAFGDRALRERLGCEPGEA
jgi:peroxiredoxin